MSGQSLLPHPLWGTEAAPQKAALASAWPQMAAQERGTAQAGLGLEEPGPCRGWGWGHLTQGSLKSSSLECRPSSRGSALNCGENGQSALLWLPLGPWHLSRQALCSCSPSSAETLRLRGSQLSSQQPQGWPGRLGGGQKALPVASADTSPPRGSGERTHTCEASLA